MRKDLVVLLAITVVLLSFLGCTTPESYDGGINVSSKKTYGVSPFDLSTVENITVLSPEINGGKNQSSRFQSYTYSPDAPLTIYFFPPAHPDHQGEAILLKKGDADILIDAGIDGVRLVHYLQKINVDDIELLIITTADPNFYRGAKTVIENYKVEKIAFPPNPELDPGIEQMKELAIRKGIERIHLEQKNQYSINGIMIIPMNPSKDPSGRFADNHNDGFVLRVKDRGFDMILPPGVEESALQRLVHEYGDKLKTEVVLLPQFGMIGGSGWDLFITKTDPRDVVITGSYEDPFNKRYTVLNKLRVRGIKVHTTFDKATKTLQVVKIISNGQEYVFYIEPALTS